MSCPFTIAATPGGGADGGGGGAASGALSAAVATAAGATDDADEPAPRYAAKAALGGVPSAMLAAIAASAEETRIRRGLFGVKAGRTSQR